MKTLNNIRYVLFAVSLVGLFANFAQNEYGLSMLWISDLFIALIFWVEAFYYLAKNIGFSKLKAIYLYAEHFFVGCFFMGWYFRCMHWPGAALLFIFPTLFIIIMYFSYLIRVARREPRKGGALALVTIIFILASICAITGQAFKTMHWPFSNVLNRFAGVSGVVFIIFMIMKKKYLYEGVKISLLSRLQKIPGKMMLVFCYFAFWGLYIQLVGFNILPGFYTLSRPHVLEKMRVDGDPRADAYDENYLNFLFNREEAINKAK